MAGTLGGGAPSPKARAGWWYNVPSDTYASTWEGGRRPPNGCSSPSRGLGALGGMGCGARAREGTALQCRGGCTRCSPNGGAQSRAVARQCRSCGLGRSSRATPQVDARSGQRNGAKPALKACKTTKGRVGQRQQAPGCIHIKIRTLKPLPHADSSRPDVAAALKTRPPACGSCLKPANPARVCVPTKGGTQRT